jgi:hypothetical protein
LWKSPAFCNNEHHAGWGRIGPNSHIWMGGVARSLTLYLQYGRSPSMPMDSMDFGLGRFLEMFEERFGRRVTTALLALVGIAIAVFCLHLVFEGFLLPIYALSSAFIGWLSNLGLGPWITYFLQTPAAKFALSVGMTLPVWLVVYHFAALPIRDWLEYRKAKRLAVFLNLPWPQDIPQMWAGDIAEPPTSPPPSSPPQAPETTTQPAPTR